MTDCDVCKPDPLPPNTSVSVPIYLPGTRHRASCPSLEDLFKPNDLLKEDLRKIREAEIEAFGFAQTYIFG